MTVADDLTVLFFCVVVVLLCCKVGWKGQVGMRAGTVWGGSAKRAWAASPSHNPTLPTAPFPTHNTWSTLGQSQLDKSPATSRASLGGVASKCVVLAWWCLCRASGVFFVAAAPRLHHLVPPHLTIPCLHKPPKHNVAVPINKVEGRLRGANPVGGGVRAAHHPMRGVGKGFGADGGLT